MAAPLSPAALPPGFEDTLVATVGGPTAIAFTPDGRLLITRKSGVLRVHRNGVLLSTPAIDITSKVCSDQERGLLGVAVDPNFASNRRIYLYYTLKKDPSCPVNMPGTPVNRVSRFILPDSNVIDPASERVLIDNIPSPGAIHNAGDLQFGKDGKLYVSVGDGGCYNGDESRCGRLNGAARERHVLLGKILRISTSGGIPSGNPFQGADSARCNLTGRTTPGKWCQETFAWGLRNPFRIAFDPNVPYTRFYINDVGQNKWEEIDLGKGGADYGWNVREGHCAVASTTDCGPAPAGMTNPLYDYGRTDGCGAVTGGAFVPDGIWPAEYRGSYLFADFVCDKIMRLRGTYFGFIASDFATGTLYNSVVAMTFGPFGSRRALYYVDYGSADIRRITFVGSSNRTPVARAVADPAYGAVPLRVNFYGSFSTDPDGDSLSYDWDFGDGTAHSTSANPSPHTYGTAGTYTARLTVRDGRGASATDTVRIDAGNSPPTPIIVAPAATERFRVGQAFTLRGAARDQEDGTLGGSSLRWEVVRHHNTHFHPFLGPTTGNHIDFTAPSPEDLPAAETSHLDIRLTATDSKGLSRTISQELRPRLVNVGFATTPSGLKLDVAGTTITAPRTVVSWEGFRLAVDAPLQRDSTGKWWSFASWSDGGAASHNITTPAAATTYRATFEEARCGSGMGTALILIGVGLVAVRFRRRARSPFT